MVWWSEFARAPARSPRSPPRRVCRRGPLPRRGRRPLCPCTGRLVRPQVCILWPSRSPAAVVASMYCRGGSSASEARRLSLCLPPDNCAACCGGGSSPSFFQALKSEGHFPVGFLKLLEHFPLRDVLRGHFVEMLMVCWICFVTCPSTWSTRLLIPHISCLRSAMASLSSPRIASRITSIDRARFSGSGTLRFGAGLPCRTTVMDPGCWLPLPAIAPSRKIAMSPFSRKYHVPPSNGLYLPAVDLRRRTPKRPTVCRFALSMW